MRGMSNPQGGPWGNACVFQAGSASFDSEAATVGGTETGLSRLFGLSGLPIGRTERTKSTKETR